METTLTKPVYRLSEDKKDQFIGILILSYLINQRGTLPLLMQGDFKVLEGVVTKMNGKGYLQVSGAKYVPTRKGEDVLKTFMQRYYEYLKIYDVYCAVDTGAGEFAFERFFDLNDEDWRVFINEPRFEDVRIAVAEFKKLDPMEIVFMSFISEGRFNLEATGWQFDIYSGLIWNDLLKICNAALSVSELNAEFPEVMENIIKKGTEVAIYLLKVEDENKKKEAEQRALELEQQEQDNATEEVVEETVVITEYDADYYYQPYTYYNAYYDPFYISPVWALPLLLFI